MEQPRADTHIKEKPRADAKIIEQPRADAKITEQLRADAKIMEQMADEKIKAQKRADTKIIEQPRVDEQKKINTKKACVIKFTPDIFKEKDEKSAGLYRIIEEECLGVNMMRTLGATNEHLGSIDSHPNTASMMYTSDMMYDSVAENYVAPTNNKLTISDRLSRFFQMPSKDTRRRKIVKKKIEATRKSALKKGNAVEKKSKMAKLMKALWCCVSSGSDD